MIKKIIKIKNLRLDAHGILKPPRLVWIKLLQRYCFYNNIEILPYAV